MTVTVSLFSKVEVHDVRRRLCYSYNDEESCWSRLSTDWHISVIWGSCYTTKWQRFWVYRTRYHGVATALATAIVQGTEGKPRHPQSQAFLEHANGDIKDIICLNDRQQYARLVCWSSLCPVSEEFCLSFWYKARAVQSLVWHWSYRWVCLRQVSHAEVLQHLSFLRLRNTNNLRPFLNCQYNHVWTFW